MGFAQLREICVQDAASALACCRLCGRCPGDSRVRCDTDSGRDWPPRLETRDRWVGRCFSKSGPGHAGSRVPGSMCTAAPLRLDLPHAPAMQRLCTHEVRAPAMHRHGTAALCMTSVSSARGRACKSLAMHRPSPAWDPWTRGQWPCTGMGPVRPGRLMHMIEAGAADLSIACTHASPVQLHFGFTWPPPVRVCSAVPAQVPVMTVRDGAQCPVGLPSALHNSQDLHL